MQDAGITFCNAWGSVIYTAHLYNSAWQEKLVNGIWRDMELALLLQGNDKIFIGGRPKKPEGAWNNPHPRYQTRQDNC